MSGANILFSVHSMDDSDMDIPSNNPYKRPMDVMSLHAEGPNLSTSRTYSNNCLTSMNISRDFKRQWGGAGDQRSVYERETSPMSLRSMPNFHSNYVPGLNPRDVKSSFCRRSTSPMSLQSTASNATDIASAMRNGKFGKHDLKIINEAYLEYIRPLIMGRKRIFTHKIAKRHKLKVYMRGARQKSDDSGDEPSDSSDSNEYMSTGTRIPTSNRFQRYKYNNPRHSFLKNRSKTDLTQFRKAIMDPGMYRDCSSDLRNNTLRNIIVVDPKNQNGIIQNESTIIHKDRSVVQSGLENVSSQIPLYNLKNNTFENNEHNNKNARNEVFKKSISYNGLSLTQKSRFENSLPYKSNIGMTQQHRFENIRNTQATQDNTLERNNTTNSQKADFQNNTSYNASFSQKHRFGTGVLLPSQRYNNTEFLLGNKENISQNQNKPLNGVNSGDDEIFPEKTIQNLETQGKRNHDIIDTLDTINLVATNIKKKKSSPKKANPKIQTINKKNGNFKNGNDFEFAVPHLPKRKCNEKRQEILISRSKQLLENAENVQQDSLQSQENRENDLKESEASCSKVSMRPSFMKRKLFTQKVDVLEEANLGSECEENSNNKIYNSLLTERNKTKKLVKNQLCLSRNVNENEDVMDLLHKIVPKDSINITHSNSARQKKSLDSEEKWDIISIISNYNNNECVSDTFTDQDESDEGDKEVQVQDKYNITTKCYVNVEKLTAPQLKATNGYNGTIKKCLQSRIKSFWDTDSESEVECVERHRATGHQHEAKGNSIQKSLLNKESSQVILATTSQKTHFNGNNSVQSKGSKSKITNSTVTKDNKIYNGVYDVKNQKDEKVQSAHRKISKENSKIKKNMSKSNKVQNSVSRRNHSTLNPETNVSDNAATTTVDETENNKNKRKLLTKSTANKKYIETGEIDNTAKNKSISLKRNRLKLDIDNSNNQTNDSIDENKNNKSKASKNIAVNKVAGRKDDVKTSKNNVQRKKAEAKNSKDMSTASDPINTSTRTLRPRKNDSKFDGSLNSDKDFTIRHSSRNVSTNKHCSTCSLTEHTSWTHNYRLRSKRNYYVFFDTPGSPLYKKTLRNSRSKIELLKPDESSSNKNKTPVRERKMVGKRQIKV